jgi:hypothetical protein
VNHPNVELAARLAQAMEDRLRENDQRCGSRSYLGTAPERLKDRMHHNAQCVLENLGRWLDTLGGLAIITPESRERIRRQAVDAANYAMMVVETAAPLDYAVLPSGELKWRTEVFVFARLVCVRLGDFPANTGHAPGSRNLVARRMGQVDLALTNVEGNVLQGAVDLGCALLKLLEAVDALPLVSLEREAVEPALG